MYRNTQVEEQHELMWKHGYMSRLIKSWLFLHFTNKSNLCGWIRMELIQLPSKAICSKFVQMLFILDKLMENTVWYNRFEVNTVSWLRKNYYSHLHSRTHTTQENPQYRKAWIYLANPQKANLISSYDGWRPLPMWPPRKREKGSCVYFHSYRGESSAA